MSWVRLWREMPMDPKWRVIARRSGRSIAEVIAIFAFMLVNAGEPAGERGVLNGWSDEDIAAALDMEAEAVAAIRAAMQGKVLDGDRLTGWDRRQPKREDGAAERARAWRENRKLERTHPNASERAQTPRIDSDAESESEAAGAASCPKPGKPVRTRKAYSEEFEGFWQAFPTDTLMSKSEAAKAWARLTEDDRTLALASVPAFRAHCAQHPDYRPVHACRYLSQRRFEGFGRFAQQQQSSGKIWIRVGTPQFDAWNVWYQDTYGKSAPSNAKGGWFFPSEMPPTPANGAAASNFREVAASLNQQGAMP
jgi:hypothetical protein